MSTTSDLSSDTDLPVIPVPRAAQCPLHPPAEFVNWRQEPGLRRAVYHGQPAWVVSRYQDIRAARSPVETGLLHRAVIDRWAAIDPELRHPLSTLRSTLLAGGDSAQAYYLLGQAYRETGKTDLARKALVSALDIAPGFEKAQELLLQIVESGK